MVDCSHANSNKDHNRQEEVLINVVSQIVNGNRTISSLMIESHLEAGNQSLCKDPRELRYGLSVTDKCIDWATTERLLRYAHRELGESSGRAVG
jgi:3-deoxy-7-phosphoheptulonate synthase